MPKVKTAITVPQAVTLVGKLFLKIASNTTNPSKIE